MPNNEVFSIVGVMGPCRKRNRQFYKTRRAPLHTPARFGIAPHGRVQHPAQYAMEPLLRPTALLRCAVALDILFEAVRTHNAGRDL